MLDLTARPRTSRVPLKRMLFIVFVVQVVLHDAELLALRAPWSAAAAVLVASSNDNSSSSSDPKTEASTDKHKHKHKHSSLPAVTHDVAALQKLSTPNFTAQGKRLTRMTV